MSQGSSENRAELVSLVEFLMSGRCTTDEQDLAVRHLASRVPYPRVTDLVFWPQSEGFDRELTAEEVVDAALAYRPIEL